MKAHVLVGLCLVSAALARQAHDVKESGVAARECLESECKIENNCRCASDQSPLPADQIAPQLIGLTFDEAVQVDLLNNYWQELLFSRSNPDGVPIGATFYVPHQYTDYEVVNSLYNYGFEIGVHSITKNNDQEYWRNATAELLQQEFQGQRQIISKFANIPLKDIVGVRTPQLQLAGNFSIDAFVASELQYDSSWPALSNNRLFPYTLDYLTTQDCSLGANCPNEAFDGFWVVPINNILGYQDKECNILASCEINGTAQEISDWLIGEIDKVGSTTRVPLTLIVESQWFEQVPTAFEALNNVLDTLLARGDIFIVTAKQILDWTKNPVPLSEFHTDELDNYASCRAVTCDLQNGAQRRNMRSCVACPAVYPWLGNPNGDPQL